jgi:hypothetical protein
VALTTLFAQSPHLFHRVANLSLPPRAHKAEVLRISDFYVEGINRGREVIYLTKKEA